VRVDLPTEQLSEHLQQPLGRLELEPVHPGSALEDIAHRGQFLEPDGLTEHGLVGLGRHQAVLPPLPGPLLAHVEKGQRTSVAASAHRLTSR
jgi:hypothetical protein